MAIKMLQLQKKRQYQEKHEKVKRKFIPSKVRKLIRRKDKLSRRILQSDSWVKNYKMMEEIENIKDDLKMSYNMRRYEYERKAIDK